MATIGSINIGISASTAALAKGLTEARGRVKGFTDSLLSVKGALVGLAGGAAAAGIGAALFESIGAANDLSSAVNGAKAVFGDAAGTITADAARMADQFGVAKAEFISSAVGLGLTFKNAGKGQQEAAALGSAVTQLGLDFAAFNDTSNEEALTALAAAFRGEFDPLERFKVQLSAAAIESEVLRSGLAKSKSEITDGAKKIATYNLLLARSKEQQGALAREAGESGSKIKAFGGTLENLKADFGQAIEPITQAFLTLAGSGVKALAESIAANRDAITKWAVEATAAGGSISEAIQFAGKVIATVADVIHTVRFAFLGLRGAWTEGWALMVDATAFGARALQELANKIPGVKLTFGDTITSIGRGLHDLAGAQLAEFQSELAKPPPSEGITSFFDKIKGGANAVTQAVNATNAATQALGSGGVSALAGKVEELEKKLREQIATFGLSSEQAEVYKLKQAGASAEVLDTAASLVDQIEEMEAAKKTQEDLAKDAERIFAATRTPLENYRNELAKLQTLAAEGLINPETLARGIDAAKADFEKEGGDAKKVAALELGSADARSAVLAHRTGGGGDPLKSLDKTGRDSLGQQRQQTTLLRQIAANNRPAEVLAF